MSIAAVTVDRRGRPLGWLLLFVGGWIAFRAAVTIGSAFPSRAPIGSPAIGPTFATAPTSAHRNAPEIYLEPPRLAEQGAQPFRRPIIIKGLGIPFVPKTCTTSVARSASGAPLPTAPSSIAILPHDEVRSAAPSTPAPLSPLPSVVPRASRWSADAWLLFRPASGGSALGGGAAAPAAQYGGSQAGAILRWRLAGSSAKPVTIYARVTGTPGNSARRAQTDGAVGFGWRPTKLPVTLSAERRIRSTGPGAFALGAAGGVDAVPLAADFRLDAYAQTGWTSDDSNTGYGDMQLRSTREVVRVHGVTLAAGAGAWAGGQTSRRAQTGRVDVGPTVQLVAPLNSKASLRVGIDWRFRIAGNADPASGPALTIATGF